MSEPDYDDERPDGPNYAQMTRVQLIAGHRKLWTKLRELAGDCAECHGTGVSIMSKRDCPDCEDIRELL